MFQQPTNFKPELRCPYLQVFGCNIPHWVLISIFNILRKYLLRLQFVIAHTRLLVQESRFDLRFPFWHFYFLLELKFGTLWANFSFFGFNWDLLLGAFTHTPPSHFYALPKLQWSLSQISLGKKLSKISPGKNLEERSWKICPHKIQTFYLCFSCANVFGSLIKNCTVLQ